MTQTIWLTLAALGLFDTVWIATTNFHVTPAGIIAPAGSVLALAGAAAFLRSRRRNRPAIALLDGIAQIIACFALCGILSYLAISTNLPFVDHEFATFDGMMGFDWPGYVAWVRAHPMLDGLLYLAYNGTVIELIVIAILLGALREERMPELAATIVISLVLTIAISGIAPAADADLYYGATHPLLVAETPVWDHLALRNGTLREIDLRRLQGLISFPSFHTILSLLFIYVVRGIRLALPISVVVNAAVIAATLSTGGHYLADLIGGAAVTVIAIALHRLADRLLSRPDTAAGPLPDPAGLETAGDAAD